MQITLKQSHIEAAIRDYVSKAGITFPVDSIDFTASRGKDGMTATVELEDPFLLEPTVTRNTTAEPATEVAVAPKREKPVEEETPKDETPVPVVEQAEEAPEVAEESPFVDNAAASSGTTAAVSLFS